MNTLFFETSRNAKEPEKAHTTDAGYDLFVNSYELIECNDYIKRYSVDTGVRVAIPDGFTGLVLPRSSISKSGVLTHTGVIDAGYTGIISVFLTVFDDRFALFLGQKIAQLVILPLPEFTLTRGKVSNMNTERGANGFGSTGA